MSSVGVPANYQPTDTLYVWYLGRPSRPIHVGEINLIRSTQGASLRYADD